MILLLALLAPVLALAVQEHVPGTPQPRSMQDPPNAEVTDPTEVPFAGDAAVRFSQAVVGKQVGAHRLFDQQGRELTLAALRGKPLVVSLIYTSCYHVCPTTTRHLGKVTGIARDALGAQSFRVVSIGFDTTVDTPQQMQRFAREQGIDDPEWLFLSTDAGTMTDLARELGFIYRRSPGGFDHLTQTSVLDAEGRVYRQVYGTSFDTQLLVEPLKELLYGQPAALLDVDGWVNNVKLFCTVFDPRTGRYRFDYSIFLNFAIGIICLGGVAIFIVRSWRHNRRVGGL
ncbi:MAG: SCO family protein [Gammaproteobacteria bacterium]|nr:SCO family protein [Gammaproteobacteria bacterium]